MRDGFNAALDYQRAWRDYTSVPGDQRAGVVPPRRDLQLDALLEIQRSLDYFESFYGMGMVTNLRVFPQLKITEKMAMYLQNLSNLDIDFIAFADEECRR